MVEIVKLPPSSWREYKAIRLEALQKEPQAFGSTYARTLELDDNVWESRLANAGTAGNSWLHFARAEEGLVGLIGGYPNEDNVSVELNSFYVRRAHRGQQVGRKLLHALLTELSAVSRLKSVSLSVNADQAAAINVYRQFGFTEGECTPCRMGDGALHEQLKMERSLPFS